MRFLCNEVGDIEETISRWSRAVERGREKEKPLCSMAKEISVRVPLAAMIETHPVLGAGSNRHREVLAHTFLPV